jgi:single-strand DNA-binding protein
MNLNKCLIAGNLVRDPETRNLQSGTSVCNFSVASNRSWKGSDGEKKEEVTYFDLVAWGKSGEVIAKYFTKGKPIFVVARASNESWDDKETGKKMHKMRFVVEEFQFVGGKGGGGSDDAPAEKPADKPAQRGFKQPGKEDKGGGYMRAEDIPFSPRGIDGF